MERATNIRAKSTAMSLVLSPTQNSEVKSRRMICAPRQNQSSSSYLDPGPSDLGGRGDNPHTAFCNRGSAKTVAGHFNPGLLNPKLQP